VAVSVAAGVKALASAYPTLDNFSAEIGVGVIVLITLINLRGIRESGSIFMLPTYVFLLCMAEAFMRKRIAADNPWGVGATTLEWTLSSPPPFHTYNDLPRIADTVPH